MLQALARYLVNSLNQGEKEYQVYYYTLKTWTHTTVTVVITFLLSYILGILKWAIIIGLIGIVLRSFSGGSHSKSSRTCALFSIIYINLFAIITDTIYVSINKNLILASITILTLIGLFLINKYAPADTPQKPIISAQFRKQLKIKSLGFIIIAYLTAIWLFMTDSGQFNGVTLSIVFGQLWQLFSITPLGYKALENLDKVMDLMKGVG